MDYALAYCAFFDRINVKCRFLNRRCIKFSRHHFARCNLHHGHWLLCLFHRPAANSMLATGLKDPTAMAARETGAGQTKKNGWPLEASIEPEP
jgi:hypothetical protein